MTTTGRIDSRELLDAVRGHAERLIRLPFPEPVIFKLAPDGSRPSPPATLGDTSTTCVLSWVDSDDGVTLTTIPNDDETVALTVGVGTTRSASELVLSLLTAEALRALTSAAVQDENHFWSTALVLDASLVADLFKRGHASSPQSFLQLCDRVVASAESERAPH